MKCKQVLAGGILAGIVIIIISLSFSWVTQTVWDYDMLELEGMRETDDPTMALFFVHPWVLGFALAYVYSYFNRILEGPYSRKGGIFGLLMWLVTGIPTTFIVFSTMNYPIGFAVNNLFVPSIAHPHTEAG